MLLRLVLYTSGLAVALAQSAVCERGFCAGYTLPKSTNVLFTRDSAGKTYILDNPRSQCILCAKAWVSETVAQQSTMYNAFRCPVCCYDYTSCYQVRCC